MSKFIGLNRVCVPLSLDCDLSCRYCYRNAGRIPKVPEFNSLMREFLGQLDSTKTQALVASGGEPLLHWDKVKELFSYAPKEMHKKVMTNGLNLTQEIVDYLNENKVEVWISHDGNATEWLRGVDVLNDPKQKDLIEQLWHLCFSCCCTNKNPDPYQCYLEIKERVKRPFYFHFNAVFADKFCLPLVEGFDYSRYQKGALKCWLKHLDWTSPIPRYYKGTGANVLPNGDIVGMCEIHHKYGTVLDTVETILKNQTALGDRNSCSNSSCPVHAYCHESGHLMSEHFCQIKQKNVELKLAMSSRGCHA